MFRRYFFCRKNWIRNVHNYIYYHYVIFSQRFHLFWKYYEKFEISIFALQYKLLRSFSPQFYSWISGTVHRIIFWFSSILFLVYITESLIVLSTFKSKHKIVAQYFANNCRKIIWSWYICKTFHCRNNLSYINNTSKGCF